MSNEYADVYYIDDILITLELQSWLEGRGCVYAEFDGAEVIAYSTSMIKGLDKSIPELWVNTSLHKQAQVQYILSKVNFIEELKKCDKSYINMIMLSIENYDMRPRYSFHGYYSAEQSGGHLYSFSFERIIYENDEPWSDPDNSKCKEVHVNYDIDMVETITGDKEILEPEFGFEVYKQQFFKHCETEFASCKGAFHLRMKEVIK